MGFQLNPFAMCWHWFTRHELLLWLQSRCRAEVTEDKLAMLWGALVEQCENRKNAAGETEVRVKDDLVQR